MPATSMRCLVPPGSVMRKFICGPSQRTYVSSLEAPKSKKRRLLLRLSHFTQPSTVACVSASKIFAGNSR